MLREGARVGPVAEPSRVIDLDVLRGVALFGVLLANLTGFASYGPLEWSWRALTDGERQAMRR